MSPETADTIRERIDDLKYQHVKDLENLRAYYAQLQRQEQEDIQISTSNASVIDPAEALALEVGIDQLIIAIS